MRRRRGTQAARHIVRTSGCCLAVLRSERSRRFLRGAACLTGERFACSHEVASSRRYRRYSSIAQRRFGSMRCSLCLDAKARLQQLWPLAALPQIV
jgi:hypothetical protein